MKRINIILAVIVVLGLAACGTSKDRCPSVMDTPNPTEQATNVVV